MVRRRRRWFWVVLAVLLLALLAGATLVRSRLDGWARVALERAFVERSGGQLTLGSLEIRLLGLRAEFREVDLRLPIGEGQSARVTVASGRARLAPTGILGLAAGRIHLTELVLDRPSVEWEEPPGGRGLAGATSSPVLDLRVDHAEVRQGRVVYSDREVPWTLLAEEVSLHAAWDPAARALAGRVALRTTVRREPFERPLSLELSGRFRVRRHDIEFSEVVAEGLGIRGGLEGNLRLSDGIAFVGRGHAGVTLEELRPLLRPDTPELSGLLSGSFSVEGGREPLRLRAEVGAESLQLGRLHADRAEATARYAEGVLQIVDLRAWTLGGVVTGTLETRWRDPAGFRLDLEGASLDAAAILRQVGLPLPASSRVDAQLALQGQADRPRTWDGGGSYVARARPGTQGDLPLDGNGELGIADGRLTLTSQLQLAAATCSSRVAADLDRPGEAQLEFEGVTVNARDTQRAVVGIVEALGQEVPDALRRPMGGAGRFRTRLGTGAADRAVVSLELSHGRYEGRRFDRLELDAESDGSTLALSRFLLSRGETRAEGRGRFGLNPISVRELEVEWGGLDVGWLFAGVGVRPELSGRLEGRLGVREEGAGTRGAGTFRLVDGKLYGEDLEQWTGELRIEPGLVQVDGWSVTARAATGSGSFRWWPAGERWELEVDRARVQLDALELVRRHAPEVGGSLVVSGTVGGTAEHVGGEMELEGREWSYAATPIGNARGNARLDHRGLAASVIGEENAGWSAELSLGWEEGLPLRLSVALDAWLLELGEGEPSPVWATLTGEVEARASLQGGDAPSVRARLSSAEIHAGGESLALGEPAELLLERGRLDVPGLRLVGSETDLRIDGSYDVRADRLEATTTGRADLGLMTTALPEVRAWGQLQADLRATGSLAAPEIEGSIRCSDGRLRWLGFPQSIDRVTFVARFDGRRALLESWRARFGTGELSGHGEALLQGWGLGSYEVHATVANVRVGYPEGFRGVYEGDLSIEGTADQAVVRGAVTMLLGEYTEEFDLTGASSRAYGVPDDEGVPDNVLLDVTFKADGNVWVRNSLADVESSFEIHVGGSLRRPQVTGRIWMFEGGELRYRDVRYRVVSGTLDFVELDRLNPYLTLQAETIVEDYAVSLRVEGTLDRFEYELTSDPPLGTPDIIALLATGRAFKSIATSEEQASFTGDVAANYFSGALTGPFEKQLERLLGLERVRIDPLLAEGESDPTTRLTLEKEVADDLFVIFSTEVARSERQLYRVDWRATRRFHFGVQRDTQGGLGGDIRYTKRFWLGQPPERQEPDAAAEAGTPEPVARGPRVTAVRFEGVGADEAARLARRVSLDVGERFSRSAMFRGLEQVKRYYVEQGRIETRVEASADERDSEAEVVYRVTPSPRVELAFEGVTDKEARRLRSLLKSLWIDSVFEQEVYDDAEQQIRESLHARGFYAADVSHELFRDPQGRRVVFRVDRGSPVRVDRVTLRGVEQLPEERVRDQMLTRPPSLFARRLLIPRVLEADVAAVRALYRGAGFLAVRVAPPDVLLAVTGETAEVVLEIEEGPRFVIESVSYPGNLPFGEEALAIWSELPAGDFFSPTELLQAESRLRAAIDRRGYPDARVRGRFEASDASVRVSFDIVPGEYKRVGEVRVSGNRRTKDRIILREMELEPGDEISRGELLRTQHRLYRLGIFRRVRLAYRPLDPAEPVLQRLEVEVDESAPLTSSLGLGYDTEAAARVSFSLTHQNLGGYDRVLAFQGKYSGLERRLQLVGQDPRLFTRRLPSLLSVGWEREERGGEFSVERLSSSVRVERRLTPRWITLLRYNIQRVELEDVEIPPEELEAERLVEGRLGDIGLSFAYDTRDDVFVPRRGRYATLVGRWFGKGLGSEFTFVKTRFEWAGVWTFRGDQSVASSARVGLAFPYGDLGAVPISEAYFAGGDSTLRGFPRDEVGPASGGEALLLLNQEFRFPIWRSFRGVVFYDAGNVWEKPVDAALDDLRHVLGLGVRLETPIGPLRLEYGRKLDRRPDESGGEVFLAIGSPF